MDLIRRDVMRFVLLVLVVSLTGPAAAEDEEEANPFVEAAKALLQDQLQGKGAGGGLAAVGGLLQNFMQSDGGRQISDALLSAGRTVGGGGGGDSDDEAPGADLLSGLESTTRPTTPTEQHRTSNNKRGDQRERRRSMRRARKQADEGGDGAGGVDWGSVLTLAGNFLSSQHHADHHHGGQSSGLEGLASLLPLLMQANSGGGGGGGAGQARRGDVGGAKPSLFGPALDALYHYWLHFTHSEFGQTLWKSSGLEATSKLFTDQDGKFDMERIYRSLENASFRKRWIKNLSAFVADWVAHVSDPSTQARFFSTAQFMGNSFLKAQGYPKAALFDPAKPAESLSRMVNSVFKRQFNLKINSATYIKPAVSYLQEVYSLGQAQGLSFTHLSSKQIESKLTETINSELIEPALRVWRAYRFALKEPTCDKYVICFVNTKDDKLSTGLKPGVTKLSRPNILPNVVNFMQKISKPPQNMLIVNSEMCENQWENSINVTFLVQ
ncbi:Uncharacterized protein GBIM_14665 [Gryllus bimaculatus]|nr:Uncharacterized protein GBIM_14665 [Gryllus bimaculatus]